MKKWMRLMESMSPDYIYVTRCSDGGHGAHGEAINDMTDRPDCRSITFEEFVKATGTSQLRQVFPGYDWKADEWDEEGDSSGNGLTMDEDYTMQDAFYHSKWYGIDCVYAVWSAIEFIFTRDGRTPESERINRRAYLDQLIDDEYNASTYYHITISAAVDQILDEGLKPRVGDRSKKVSESHEGIYLFKETEDAENALMNWLGDEFGDEVELTMLRVEVPPDIKVWTHADDPSLAEYEHVVREPIPGHYISIEEEDL